MADQFVRTENTGVALVCHVIPNKVTEREAGVIEGEIAAVAPPAAWNIAVDLSEVMLLASAGLGALLTINKKCREGKGRLVIFGLSEEILGMMKIARLDKVLAIYPNRDKALKQFK